jgi:4'-phosphopantetheinyl transferase EntD
MDMPTEPIGVTGPRLRLVDGLTVLERWAETANQSHKNSVYKALFAVTDGSVFQKYVVFSDRSDEIAVMVKADLVVSIAIHHPDTFAISYIGAVGSPTDVDLGIDLAS